MVLISLDIPRVFTILVAKEREVKGLSLVDGGWPLQKFTGDLLRKFSTRSRYASDG